MVKKKKLLNHPKANSLSFFLPAAKMSKRQADAEPETSTAVRAKRARSSQKEAHVDDCTDPECQGCDVGEIEIAFVRKDEHGQEQPATPSAQELLDMAMAEASQKQQRDDHLVRRLFDLALEQYQENEAENRIGYATCLIELGRAIHVEESLREGLDILRGLNKQQSLENQQQLLLARAAMDLAIFIRKRQNALFEEMLDSDEEEPSEDLLNKQKVSREEIKLCKEALDAIDKVNMFCFHVGSTLMFVSHSGATFIGQDTYQRCSINIGEFACIRSAFGSTFSFGTHFTCS